MAECPPLSLPTGARLSVDDFGREEPTSVMVTCDVGLAGEWFLKCQHGEWQLELGECVKGMCLISWLHDIITNLGCSL